MAMSCTAFLLVALVSSGSAMSTDSMKARSGDGMEVAANPMRRVITMLQLMEKKVIAEGKKEKELFDKFMCYCKNGKESLGKSISDAETKIPQLESDIKETVAEKAQLDADIEKHKADRDAAKAAMQTATATREKEASAFAKESGEDKSNIEAMTKAIAAIEKGMAGGFLQTSTASVLRRLSLTQSMSEADRDMLSAFLSQGSGQGYAPASGEIVGILKQMKDTMEKDLAELIAQEEKSRSDYDGMMGAKTKEADANQAGLEDKMKRTGEVAVEIVNLKEDLEDTVEQLADDKKMLADLEKNCDTRQKEWDEQEKTRADELLAIADVIKMLSDDDALELFKKTLPGGASLLQVQTRTKQVRDQALRALQGASGRHSAGIDLIALALRGKKVNFDKVIVMIDDMVALLGKEQVDDDAKKEYCEAEFDKSDDTKKELERKISDLEKALDEDKATIETITAEVKALNEGIHALDKDVAEATEDRKEEHAEATAMLAANQAAMGLIDMAKNRLNKFYNPKMYKPPPKRELTEEERITLNMGGTLAPTNAPGGIAGTGISAFVEFKKQGQAANGVMAMMDMLKADLVKETQEIEFGEKDAQEDYTKLVLDAAAKRGADLKSIEEKEAAKAELEATVVRNTEEKTVKGNELMATKEYIAELHADCDWLLEKYQERKTARADEVEALKNAKAVLSGADYSLVQTSRHLSKQ